ncbi:glycosyltransferase [Photobacterium damselae]|uniref:glycosyltransferase n=1 Tax=Photobacterium damselae TaxID=38293 RepID=UPI0040689BA7
MKILYISYFSPPLLNVGAHRTRRFASHLTTFNHKVTVIAEKRRNRFTQQSKDALSAPNTLLIDAVKSWNIDWIWKYPTIVHKGLYRLFGRTLPEQDNKIAKRYWFIDMQWGWIIPTLWHCYHLIKQYKPDVILVTCPPFSSSVVGYSLSKFFSIPLVLDFRDGWTHASYFVEYDYQHWESRVLAQASALVVTSKADLHSYQSKYPKVAVSYIPNSFDWPLDITSNRSSSCCDSKRVFTIGYSGTWDGFRRSAKQILTHLSQASFDFRFINIGDDHPEFLSLVNELKIEDKVRNLGLLNKDKMLKYLADCDALFIQKGLPDLDLEDTHLATKAIDYVASRRMIIAELPKGETKQFLLQYGGNVVMVDADNYPQQLESAYQDWHSNPNKRYEPKGDFWQQYDPILLSRQLEKVCYDVCSGSSQPT